MDKMKILITGATGMLGSSIMLTKTNHDFWGTYFSEKPLSNKILELDITKKEQVRNFLKCNNPDAIIHTAAITNVDLCEKDPRYAKEVHVLGTRNLVEFSKENDIYFLYVSTDSVFDGTKGNYMEEDAPNPLNIYAKTKYEGELEALKNNNSSVIRINIYGYNWLPKQSIAEWIVNTLRKEEKMNLFKDVFFSPILTNYLAEILLKIIERKLTGIYHVACQESVSKLEFGKKIAQIYNLREDLINSISISDLNLAAPRPLYPTLNCLKIQDEIGIKLLNIHEGLVHFKYLESAGYLELLKNL